MEGNFHGILPERREENHTIGTGSALPLQMPETRRKRQLRLSDERYPYRKKASCGTIACPHGSSAMRYPAPPTETYEPTSPTYSPTASACEAEHTRDPAAPM